MSLEHRIAECPDPEASCLHGMEFHFQTVVWLTQNHQRRLHQLLHEIVSAPWNQPVEGVHWLAEWGSKPQWREPQEPTFDDSILTGASCARGFASEKERSRVLAERSKPEKQNPTRDVAIEALEAVMHFWGKDPKAFGDYATLNTMATQFEKIARKCRRALSVLKEAKLIERNCTGLTCPLCGEPCNSNENPHMACMEREDALSQS